MQQTTEYREKTSPLGEMKKRKARLNTIR